ncbi:ornithine cyclodeaminase family protein [Humitalea sp. 24SJ18S-53]|uniref:ornithine cyclodeaminase family protein n=1 Tax=Humitalea sp. 24SJ18S-53 TaxID=3422307 RepID=UPI003D679169
MIMLDAAAVAARLPWGPLEAALRSMFRTGCTAPLRHRHAVPQPDGRVTTLLLMPAWSSAGFTGVKIVHVAPGNGQRGLPAVHAAYLLSDGATGAPVALLDGAALTDRRTAAASVLAAGYLARPDSRRLLLLGAGRVAHALAEAYAHRFPLADIAIWTPGGVNGPHLAETLRASGLPARATISPNPADFDIVAAATLATAPLILGATVSPGTHIDLVGAYRPDMRESDAALLARATLVVDTRDGALAEAGDILQAIAEGAITATHVVADLADLCRGLHPGRQTPQEVTVFKSVGWAGEDLAAAILAMAPVENSVGELAP